MTAQTANAAQERPAGSGRPSRWTLFCANRLAVVGLVIFSLILVLALVEPLLPLPGADDTETENRLAPPLSDGHLLGTDHLGRDLLGRLLEGTRVSLAVGISATLIAAIAGSAIGLVAGYAGGRADNLIMRGVDMLMAFPYILLALAIVAAAGPGLMNALYAIAVVNIPFFARNVRGVTVTLVRREFVDAARLSGKGPSLIVATEVLPNVLPTIVITMSTTVGWMILETAGLSFLGLGAQPPQADLGSMLGDGRKVLYTDPHEAIVPGVMIFLLVMSINLVGDGLRDLLDPRLKSGALARPSARTAVRSDRPRPEAGDSEAPLAVAGLQTHFTIGKEVYRAVDDVTFALKGEECLGLVGESGSGKSVTALTLLGLVPTPPGRVVGGRVDHHGRDLLDLPTGQLRRLRGGRFGFIFQDPLSTLHPLFTVEQQISEALQAHQRIARASARARTLELLRMVRIPNAERRLDAYPHELSGGMRQRVAIAMALANDPEVVIADEPTTALDVTVQAQVLKLLSRLRREQHTAVLFITHDFGIVSEICDRVAVMYAGRIVEVGPANELLARPAHPYTRKLIDCVPVLGEPERRLDAIPGLPPPVNRLPPGCAFAPRCARARAECREGEISLDSLGEGRAARCLFPLAEVGESV